MMDHLVVIEWEGAKRTEHTRGTLIGATKDTLTVQTGAGVFYYVPRQRVMEVMPTESP